MALPKIESTKHETKIPSTGEMIEFRPFLVKEEKILLIAQESDNVDDILKAMKEVISTCTFEKVDPNTLSTYDLEYLFLQLRAKSVGETAELQIRCESCEEYTKVKVDISAVEVVFPEIEVERDIMLTDTIGVSLRSIPVSDIGKFSEDDPGSVSQMLASCIEKIYDTENVYLASDASETEMIEFVESLNRKQVAKIEDFLANQPRLKKQIEFKCPKCGHDNSITLEGLQSFFE